MLLWDKMAKIVQMRFYLREVLILNKRIIGHI